MASTTSPRWLTALTEAISLPENKNQNIIQLGTIEKDEDGEAISRVRAVGYRTLLHPTDSPHLPIIVFGTDVRTPKVEQLRIRPRAELAWWLSGSRDQFRLTGTVRIVSSPSAEVDLGKAGSPLPSAIALQRLDSQGFDFEKKRIELYSSAPGFIRASYCRPPPGSVIRSYEEAKEWPASLPNQAGTEEDKQNLEAALSRYALVLLEVTEVDWCQLGVAPSRRTKFVRKGENWEETILVP